MKKQTPSVFILNGVAQSGKDEFYLAIKDTFNTLNVSSVDEIKDIAAVMGWNGVKDEKSRKFLSDLKDLHTEYNDGPFNYVTSTIKASIHDVIICHIREPHEITKLKDWCRENNINCTSVLVTRPGTHVPSNTGDIGATQKYEYNVVIDNDDTLEKWHKKCRMIVGMYTESN